MPCGVGGVPTGAGLVDGGVDQGHWLQERVGLDSGLGWLFQKPFQRGASPQPSENRGE